MASEGIQLLVEHDGVRAWAEAHGARPVADGGTIGLAFGPMGSEGASTPWTAMSWDEWLRRFDVASLALRFDTATDDASTYELVRRHGNEAPTTRPTFPEEGGEDSEGASQTPTVAGPGVSRTRTPRPRRPTATAVPTRRAPGRVASEPSPSLGKPRVRRGVGTKEPTPVRTKGTRTQTARTQTARTQTARTQTARTQTARTQAAETAKTTARDATAAAPRKRQSRTLNPTAARPAAGRRGSAAASRKVAATIRPARRSAPQTVTTLARVSGAKKRPTPANRRSAPTTVRARGGTQTVSADADRPPRRTPRRTAPSNGAKNPRAVPPPGGRRSSGPGSRSPRGTRRR
jgi:hypothetical protein